MQERLSIIMGEEQDWSGRILSLVDRECLLRQLEAAAVLYHDYTNHVGNLCRDDYQQQHVAWSQFSAPMFDGFSLLLGKMAALDDFNLLEHKDLHILPRFLPSLSGDAEDCQKSGEQLFQEMHLLQDLFLENISSIKNADKDNFQLSMPDVPHNLSSLGRQINGYLQRNFAFGSAAGLCRDLSDRFRLCAEFRRTSSLVLYRLNLCSEKLDSIIAKMDEDLLKMRKQIGS